VPALVPKPGTPTVTQEHLLVRYFEALRALGLSWVMLDSEICSLKIRVSALQPSRAAATDARSAPAGRAKQVNSAPGHHLSSSRATASKSPFSLSSRVNSMIALAESSMSNKPDALSSGRIEDLRDLFDNRLRR